MAEGHSDASLTRLEGSGNRHPEETMPDARLYEPLSRWRVVLVSPQNAENVGAVARLIMNFGHAGLWIVNPRCEIDVNGDAGKLSRGPAHGVLQSARFVESLEEALTGTTVSLATTMHEMVDRPCEIQGFDPSALLKNHLQGLGALVFGREDNGLTNAECSLCTYRWAFTLNPQYPSMNLAQAVAAVSTSLRVTTSLENKTIHDNQFPVASFEEVDGLIKHLQEMMDVIEFERGVPMEYPLRLIRRLASRSGLMPSDVQVIRGICRRVINATKKGSSQ